MAPLLCLKEQFDKSERMFLTGKTDTDFHGKIVPDGILHWGRYIYHNRDTMEAYLEEYGIPSDWRYPVGVHDIVDADQWLGADDSVYDSETGKYVPINWRSCIDSYIDDMDDNTVLVAVDYHI